MSIDSSFIISAAQAIQHTILAHEADLESLDRAIGDGDHYINMKRGATAIVEMQAELQALSTDLALNKIGMKLLSTIGGASGPLLASFFMGMAKIIKEHNNTDISTCAAAFSAGVDTIRQRGKADVGEKTMLDVLIPVAATFKQLAEQGKSAKEIASALKDVASKGLESTRNMLATKGRASGLGERAIGHLDAGAKSCQVMIHTVCDVVISN